MNDKKLNLLRISNSILKRLSSSMDTQFRGKVQMALASIFPISDKSGVNQKGLYNLNNATNCGLQKNEEENNVKMVNYRFYKQFWVLHKFLTNPFLVKIIYFYIIFTNSFLQINLRKLTNLLTKMIIWNYLMILLN